MRVGSRHAQRLTVGLAAVTWLLGLGYDSRFGCERSRAQCPEQPHASFGVDAGMTWHYQGITLAIANFLRPQGKHYLSCLP
jgi:hypothetical protein